jgi:DNA-damage-inducible protein J
MVIENEHEMSRLSIRVDSAIKEEAMNLFYEMGLDLSTAVNLFLRQAVHDKALPFKPSLDDGKQAALQSFLDSLSEAKNSPIRYSQAEVEALFFNRGSDDK